MQDSWVRILLILWKYCLGIMDIVSDYLHGAVYNILNIRNVHKISIAWGCDEYDRIGSNSCSNSFKIYL